MKKTRFLLLSILLGGIHFASAQSYFTSEWLLQKGGSNRDDANDIIACPDSGYIVIGRSPSNDKDVDGNLGESDMWILRISETGALLWKKNFGTSLSDGASRIIRTRDHHYIAAGFTSRTSGDFFGERTADLYLVKFDSLGNKRWDKKYGGSMQETLGNLLELPNGDLVIVSSSSSADEDLTQNKGNYDGWILKLNSEGKVLKQKSFGGTGGDYLKDLVWVPPYLAAAGVSGSVNGDIKDNHGQNDMWLVVVDTSLQLVTSKCFGTPNQGEIANAIAPLADGSLALGGIHYSNNTRVSSVIKLKEDYSLDSVYYTAPYNTITRLIPQAQGQLLVLTQPGSSSTLSLLDNKGKALWTKQSSTVGEIESVVSRKNQFVLVGNWLFDGVLYDYLVEKTCGKMLETVTNTGNTLQMVGNLEGCNLQWLDCNSRIPVPNATASAFTLAKSGSYRAVAHKGGCADTSNCYVVVLTAMDSPNLLQDDASPYVSQDVLYNPSEERVSFEIVDLAGKKVWASSLDPKGSEKLSNLHGFYMVQTKAHSETRRRKVYLP